MTSDLFDLTGRVTLVTGSSGGLGRVIARGLARAGATVVLNGRDQEKVDAAVAAFADEGLAASGRVFDVTDPAAVGAAVTAIEAEVGPIDVLVNNAGLQQRSPLAEMSQADWDAVIGANLTGPFVCARAVVGSMIERGRGKIINICSLMSELARATTGNYAAAKGGLKMLTRAMALEWAPHGISVNGLGPGYFATDMTRPLREDPEFDRWLRNRTPAGRWGAPGELVGPAVFLASEASSFVTGHVLYVDGGILAAL